MIDCGIPYKKMKDDLYKCDALLLTHIHTDHIKPSTLMSINADFPRIQTYGNPTTAYKFYVNHIISSKPFTVGDMTITPFEGEHDVEVTYFVIQKGDLNIIYATDTNKVENLLGLKFDYLFLESNYDERKLAELSKQYTRKGYNPYDSSFRHLSTQKCKEFYYVNRRNRDSKLIELHMSNRFY